MKKIALALVMLALASTALVGCRASGEIDPEESSPLQMPQ